MKTLRPALLACALLLGAIQQSTAALPTEVARALKFASIPQENVALWIGPASGSVSSAGSQASWQHNADKPVNPASVMKLLTSYAALDLLGPAYTWKTQAFTTAPLQDGVLNGDLAIRGSGDPSLTWDKLAAWLRDWRARGLRDIRGDIVIDRSLFLADLSEPRDFDSAPQRAYNATPDAFLVNFNALTILISANGEARTATANALIPVAPLRLRNAISITEGACNDWKGGIKSTLSAEGAGFALLLEGSFPRACGERLLHINVPDPLRWSGSVLRALWQEQGGTWNGNLRAGTVPASAPLFSIWESPPLVEALRNLNKFSNNVMARQVFLTLGTDASTQTTSTTKAAIRVGGWMADRGLMPSAWTLENGSGLSRIERTTASQLGSLLRLAWQSPRMPEFMSALPVLGIDGTMHSRMTDSPETGRAYIKTGTLEGVKAAAGYVLDAKGRWQAFAFIVNHSRAYAGEVTLEALIKGIYEAQ